MIPHAAELLDSWQDARRRARRLLVALDFDGTLAPIVDHPAGAALPPRARGVLERLARRPDTDVAVVSGRALEDVRGRVELDGIFYAGNHGMEIEGPGVQSTHREAAEARPAIARCAEEVRAALQEVPGVVVEDKGLTLSVHYRLARGDDVPRVAEAVRRACGEDPALRVTRGKMVLEVRPAVDWDKGSAIRLLLEVVEAGAATPVPVVYFGDDATDEDAFRALRGRGTGVLVADPLPESTAASAWLRSPDEVVDLLASLAEPG